MFSTRNSDCKYTLYLVFCQQTEFFSLFFNDPYRPRTQHDNKYRAKPAEKLKYSVSINY